MQQKTGNGLYPLVCSKVDTADPWAHMIEIAASKLGADQVYPMAPGGQHGRERRHGAFSATSAAPVQGLDEEREVSRQRIHKVCVVEGFWTRDGFS
jgi:hypothetical protein